MGWEAGDWDSGGGFGWLVDGGSTWAVERVGWAGRWEIGSGGERRSTLLFLLLLLVLRSCRAIVDPLGWCVFVFSCIPWDLLSVVAVVADTEILCSVHCS